MKIYKISHTETVTEEDILGMVWDDDGREEAPTPEEALEEYLWTELRPEGDDWDVEIIEE